MKRWEKMEEWLFNYFDGEPRPGARFSSIELSVASGVSREEASRMIQAYLDAQRRPQAATLYVLKREGRTAQAMWSVGQRRADARVINDTLFEDVRVKVRRGWEKDLTRLAHRNPRSAKYVEEKLVAVIDGALIVLAHALKDNGFDGGDEPGGSVR